MIRKSKLIYLLLLIFLGVIDRTNGQSKQMNSSEFQRKFHNILRQYQKLDTTGIVIISQISNNESNLYRFSRLESQEMLLKNKPTSYFFVAKKLILYYGLTELKENIAFDSTETDKALFKALVKKSNKKLIDDFPKSKYLIVSSYDPIEWIVKINKKGIGIHDKEATQKIKIGNPRWKI